MVIKNKNVNSKNSALGVIFNKQISRITIILLWLIIFFVFFTRLKIFSWGDSDLTGEELVSFNLRESEEPRYKEEFKSVMGLSNNTELIVELVPDSTSLFDGFDVKLDRVTHVRINSRGFRDYEYTIEKPQNTYRIIVLGDSFTFGLGVELNETYPKLLEESINNVSAGRGMKCLILGCRDMPSPMRQSNLR